MLTNYLKCSITNQYQSCFSGLNGCCHTVYQWNCLTQKSWFILEYRMIHVCKNSRVRDAPPLPSSRVRTRVTFTAPRSHRQVWKVSCLCRKPRRSHDSGLMFSSSCCGMWRVLCCWSARTWFIWSCEHRGRERNNSHVLPERQSFNDSNCHCGPRWVLPIIIRLLKFIFHTTAVHSMFSFILECISTVVR